MSAQMSTPGDPPGGVPAAPDSLVMCAIAARRHYLDEVSKSAIAHELGVSRFKVARLLRQARDAGLVRIELNLHGVLDLDLSMRLRTHLGLTRCLVVTAPDEADAAAQRAAVGRAAASLLAEIASAHDVIGISGGRALMAMRSSLTRLPPCEVVQITGAVTQQDLAESSIELVRDFAKAGGGTGRYFHAPMLMPDEATARALRAHADVARTAERFGSLTMALVGVGAWAPGLSTVADMLDDAERRELLALGTQAEVAGLLLDDDGALVDSRLGDRRVGIDAAELRAVPEVIALVYGVERAAAARAAVRGGFVESVVTHAGVARAMLELEPLPAPRAR